MQPYRRAETGETGSDDEVVDGFRNHEAGFSSGLTGTPVRSKVVTAWR